MGLKYAIEQQAKTNSNIFTSSWVVKGRTKNMAEKNANNVIICAINDEVKMSERTIKQNRGFRELKAKESEKVRYNAAWCYHCTYRSGYGDNPKHVIHPAYKGK